MSLAEKIRQHALKLWRDLNNDELRPVYEDDDYNLKEGEEYDLWIRVDRLLAVVNESLQELKELAKNLELIIKEKTFPMHVGHVGLAEGRMQVIDVGFVKKHLEELKAKVEELMEK